MAYGQNAPSCDPLILLHIITFRRSTTFVPKDVDTYEFLKAF